MKVTFSVYLSIYFIFEIINSECISEKYVELLADEINLIFNHLILIITIPSEWNRN